jgi:hypothetical protein
MLTLTVYARPDTPIERAVQLAVSADGASWEAVAYRLRQVSAKGKWQQAEIEVGFNADTLWNRLRLTLAGTLSSESLQLGRLLLVGYQPSP